MTHRDASFDDALSKFGLQSFRPGQREVIESIVAGNDCMCVMPTGGGKSLCYQLPSLIRPGLTIVVSPLIALMKDQVDGLGRRGIPAALINSTLSQSEQQQRLQDVAAGKYQLVYVAPERLRNNRFLEAIRATPIQLLAIDEAHCISQWGHDFRPDYARIGRFREWLGGVQTVALTATATPRVREDIVQVLGLRKPKQFMSGFARPNLHFGVVARPNDREKDEELEKFLAGMHGSGIIYAATRKRCEALVEWIGKKLKVSVGAYHAGLMPDQRRVIQERFMKNELRIIVATNAFGMGIDKPDLRFVIHYNMPGSLEAYYQEAGRAGRDGKQSVCVMLYSYQDRHIQEFFIDNNYPPRELIAKTYDFLAAREEDPIELTLEEIRDALGENVSPEAIGSSLQVLGRTGVIERLEMGGGLAMLRIDSQLPTLVDLLPREARVQRKVLRVIERAIGDRRGEQVFVHPRWLLQATEMERENLSRALRELCKLDGFDYVPPFRGRAVHFLRRDVPFSSLEIDFEALDKLKKSEYDRLNQVVNYAQSPLCRQATILNYFGDPSAENCGQCDRCGRSPGWPQLRLPQVKNLAAIDDAPAVDSSGRPATDTNRPAVFQRTGEAGQGGARQSANSKRGGLSDEQKLSVLEDIVRSIERIHGRIGKILLAQYLCGSQNSKLQKLNLHRLSGFGMLVGFRQSDGVELIDLLLATGILRQQEVNRNRPTVSVAPQLADPQLRTELLAGIVFPAKLETKLVAMLRKTNRVSQPPAAEPSSSEKPTVSGLQTSGPPASALPTPSQPQPAQTGPPAAPPSLGSQSRPTRTGMFDFAEFDSEHGTIARRHSGSPEERSVGGGASDKPPLDAPVGGAHGSSTGSPTEEAKPDWQWTLTLFKAGHSWAEVIALRRMSDSELAESLAAALAGGGRVDRSWLAGSSDSPRTAGQQRVVHEIRRKSAAWTN
jgi:ATP-dependent DNA helicase RecQ